MATDLLPGEEPLALVREHWSVIAGPVAGAWLVFAAGVVALLLIPASVGGLALGGLKLAIVAALIGVALLWCGVHYLRWRLTTFLLTDRRIIAEGGVLSRYAESITLDRIQNTVLRRPLGDRLIGAGDIEIESAGRDGVEVMHRIPRASQFYARLLQAIQDVPPHEQRWSGSRSV
jgi:uncharacterized membrane protein YdbT with pleckstrin-like domain